MRGGALTGGVNRLPPVGGLIDFSVGVTEGGPTSTTMGAVVVVGVVSGALFELPPHAAVRPTIATTAAPSCVGRDTASQAM